MTDLGLVGQVVVVTGAGNGLGRAHALLLAAEGAIVVVNDIGASTDGTGADPRAADHVVAEITESGGTATPSYESVACAGGCEALIDGTIATHGRIDALVHNAGILRNAPIPHMTDERIMPVLGVHLLGALWLTRAVWPHMVEQGYGRLVYTASGTGAWGRPEGANYAAAKAGTMGVCNVAAIEGEEHGILANAVLPVGATRLAGMPDAADMSPEAMARRHASTSENPRKRPEWVSPLVAWLASPACDRTHRFYSAVMGRYAEVFVGATKDWIADADIPTPRDIAAHLGEIEDRASYVVPSSVFDEVAHVAGRLPS